MKKTQEYVLLRHRTHDLQSATSFGLLDSLLPDGNLPCLQANAVSWSSAAESSDEKSSRSKRCRADFPGGSSQERGGGRGLPGTTVGFQGAMAFQATPLLPQDRGLATAGEDGAPSPGLGRHCAKCLGLSGTGVRVWHILEAWVSEPEQQSSRACHAGYAGMPRCTADSGKRSCPDLGRRTFPTRALGSLNSWAATSS